MLLDAAALTTRILERTLAPLDLPPTQVRMLAYLAGVQPVTVVAAARASGLERHSASQLVQRMVQRGLVKRTPEQRDRRQIWLSLKPDGQAALRQAETLLEQLGTALLGDGQTISPAALLNQAQAILAAGPAGTGKAEAEAEAAAAATPNAANADLATVVALVAESRAFRARARASLDWAGFVQRRAARALAKSTAIAEGRRAPRPEQDAAERGAEEETGA